MDFGAQHYNASRYLVLWHELTVYRERFANMCIDKRLLKQQISRCVVSSTQAHTYWSITYLEVLRDYTLDFDWLCTYTFVPQGIARLKP